MQHYLLKLFRKDEQHFDLQIFDDQQRLLTHSPMLEQAQLDTLFALSAQDYQVRAPDLIQRGQALFDWLESHTQGWLRDLRHQQQAIALHIDIAEDSLRHLPWELLHDGENYLCADANYPFTPLHRASAKPYDWQAEKRQLNILFMASSPENVRPVLNFEAEEASILQATDRKPLLLHVEESGSLYGLEDTLSQQQQTPDIIHISGHATVREQQPLFLLEDEFGDVAEASPQQLARTLRDANSKPKILFLSGCQTGESSQQHQMQSFCEQMVNSDIPIALGWALPVGDQAATTAAAVLYDKLATGFDLASAIALSRQALFEQKSPYWHLLRCYNAAASFTPLVMKGRFRSTRANTPRDFLDAAAGKRIPVCPRNEFIGRRRLLQRSLRSLTAWSDDEHYAEGVLLHGMGGLGKSSAAARLVDRLRDKFTLVVCYGGFDDTVLINALSKALPKARELLNDTSQTLAQRLYALFSPSEPHPYTDKPILLVLDDFEQNIPLDKRRQGKLHYTPASQQTFNQVLQTLHDSNSDSRVIMTNRFTIDPPPLCRLHTESLPSLHGAELDKKLQRLPHLQAPTNGKYADIQQQALDIAAGNPRLLEWLHEVIANPQQLDVAELLQQLANKEQVFREDVLIQQLIDAQPSAIRRSLACTAIYHIPVTLQAIDSLQTAGNNQQHLQQAAQLGLVEIVPQRDTQHYFISPLLHEALAAEISPAESPQLAAQAAQYLATHHPQAHDETIQQEIIRLAVAGQAQQVAADTADKLAFKLLNTNRYHEAEQLCQQVLTLGDDFRLLTTLARSQQLLGKGASAQQHIENAMQRLPVDTMTISDELLKETAYTKGAYADILQARGQLDDALNIRQTEQLPVYEKLGDVRSLLVGRTNLAILLWQMDAEQNRGQVQELLCLAWQDAQRLQIPEAGQIKGVLQQMGLSCNT